MSKKRQVQGNSRPKKSEHNKAKQKPLASAASGAWSSHEAALLQMQQQYGNAHVRRWLGAQAPSTFLQRQNGTAPSTETRVSSDTSLQRGSRGPSVRQIQQVLLRAGYRLGRYGADGIFGRVTERALRCFQRDHDLPPTGVVDAQTEAALMQTTTAGPTQTEATESGTAPRVDLGPRQRGRAYMLDWNARHSNIAQDTTLREAFLENLGIQITTIFGEALTQAEVLQQIEQAEAAGDAEKAEHLLAQLRIANQYAVVETLKVEQSERYQKWTREVNGKQKTSTYCNIYAYDVVTALGGYLPRVWWKRGALARLRRGEEVQPVYGRTVHELNANALTEWMTTYGGEFGWRQAEDITAAQETANRGALVIILAANANPRRSGHVTVLMPETEQHQAERGESGTVLAPLQSQAGSRNFRYETNFRKGRRQWWEDRRHERGAAWIYEGQPSSPLLSPEQLGYRSD